MSFPLTHTRTYVFSLKKARRRISLRGEATPTKKPKSKKLRAVAGKRGELGGERERERARARARAREMEMERGGGF
jgi:hypothetical protein